MLLTLDAGNTSVKLAQFDSETTHPTLQHASIDSLPGLLEELSSQASIQAVALCSSGPTVTQQIQALLQAVNLPEAFVLSTQQAPKEPVDISAYTNGELGPDRYANLLAVQQAYPNQACLVLDFGTALTLDAVSDRGRYLGGMIFPGLRTYANLIPSLSERVAPLESLPTYQPPNGMWMFGRSTQEGLEAALLSGYVGGVYRSIGFMKSKIKNPLIIATGGGVEAFQRMEATPDQISARSMLKVIDPLLTLKGLAVARSLSG